MHRVSDGDLQHSRIQWLYSLTSSKQKLFELNGKRIASLETNANSVDIRLISLEAPCAELTVVIQASMYAPTWDDDKFLYPKSLLKSELPQIIKYMSFTRSSASRRMPHAWTN